jgi:CRISPR-associated protein Cmr4
MNDVRDKSKTGPMVAPGNLPTPKRELADLTDNMARYYAIALDPIHVGTGGYRLGRVDNSIVREPGTNLPKIPGTSISGVARAYTAIVKNKYRHSIGGQTYMCAGKGGGEGEKHCGQPGCPVCTTYGFSKGKTGSSFQGLAQFFDARILFFPVHSMIGPVWVTCPSVLAEHGINETEPAESTFRRFPYLDAAKKDIGISTRHSRLNLGWLLLTKQDDAGALHGKLTEVREEIRQRAVLISNGLFSRVVNDNLEVRTSVAIDPDTGAAEDQALYTYEAIPRATVLWFDVVFNKPEFFRITRGGGFDEQPIQHGKTDGAGWTWVQENVKEGLGLMKLLGVGGMNTRGMGRLEILNL